MSKGSKRRPENIEKYSDNYDKIFNRKKLSEREKVLMDPLAASERSDKRNKKKLDRTENDSIIDT